jgi:hypothetical protein
MCMRGRGGCGRFRGGCRGWGGFWACRNGLQVIASGWVIGFVVELRGITVSGTELGSGNGGRVNSVIAVSVPGFGKKCRGGWVILSHSTSGGGELKCS